jgi:hypothetical protein
MKTLCSRRIFSCLIIFGLSSILCKNAFSQTTITGVVSDSLGMPIPYANVYLSKTSYGVVTDHEGRYSLTIRDQGYYDMIASCVGYLPVEQKIHSDGKEQIIHIKLSINYIRLNEVTIGASERLKKKYYKLFIKQFIGETTNSRHCKIQNLEELYLYQDSQKENLMGSGHHKISQSKKS